MKKILPLLLFGLSLNLFSQKISSPKWSDLFSYNNVLSIREDNGKLIAATENGIFYYTPATGEVTISATEIPSAGANNHSFDVGYREPLKTRSVTVVSVGLPAFC